MDAFKEIQAPVPLSGRQEWLKGFMSGSWEEQPEALWHWRREILTSLEALDRPTVIFTHFLVINTVLAHLNESPRTVHCWPDNASFHGFTLEEGSLKLLALGRTMQTRIN